MRRSHFKYLNNWFNLFWQAQILTSRCSVHCACSSNKSKPVTYLLQKHHTIHIAGRWEYSSSCLAIPTQIFKYIYVYVKNIIPAVLPLKTRVDYTETGHSALGCWCCALLCLTGGEWRWLVFLRIAAGVHATGHHAWTPVQLFPIVLDSGADLYSSHSRANRIADFRDVQDTPRARNCSLAPLPFSALPSGQPHPPERCGWENTLVSKIKKK